MCSMIQRIISLVSLCISGYTHSGTSEFPSGIIHYAGKTASISTFKLKINHNF